jgi:hypothetical protein
MNWAVIKTRKSSESSDRQHEETIEKPLDWLQPGICLIWAWCKALAASDWLKPGFLLQNKIDS